MGSGPLRNLAFTFALLLAFAGGEVRVEAKDPPVSVVRSNDFSEVSDPELKQALRDIGVHQVDFARHPEYKTALEKLRKLVDQITITSRDGTGRVHIIIADDARVAAGIVHAENSARERAIVVNVGLLGYATTDDQIAFLLGHELEHPVSQLRGERLKLDRHYIAQKFKAALMKRVEESEVDVKSAVLRVHQKGFNIEDSLEIERRLLADFGDLISSDHSSLSTRTALLENVVTGVSRGMGERPHPSHNELISPSLQTFLASDALAAERRAAVERELRAETPEFRDLMVRLRDHPEELAEAMSQWDKKAQDMNKNWIRPFSEAFSKRIDEVERLGGLIGTSPATADLHLSLQKRMLDQLWAAKEEVLGKDWKPTKISQIEVLLKLERQSRDSRFTSVSNWPRVVEVLHSLQEAREEKASLLQQARAGDARAQSRIVALDREIEVEMAKSQMYLAAFKPEARELIAEIVAAKDKMEKARSNVYAPGVQEKFSRLEAMVNHLGGDVALGEARRAEISGMVMEMHDRVLSGEISLNEVGAFVGNLSQEQQTTFWRKMLGAQDRYFEAALKKTRDPAARRALLRNSRELLDTLLHRAEPEKGVLELRECVPFIKSYVTRLTRFAPDMLTLQMAASTESPRGSPIEVAMEGLRLSPELATEIFDQKTSADYFRARQRLALAELPKVVSQHGIMQGLDFAKGQQGTSYLQGLLLALDHREQVLPINQREATALRSSLIRSIMAKLPLGLPQGFAGAVVDIYAPTLSDRPSDATAEHRRNFETLRAGLQILAKKPPAVRAKLAGIIPFDSFMKMSQEQKIPRESAYQLVSDARELFGHQLIPEQYPIGEHIKAMTELSQLVEWAQANHPELLRQVVGWVRTRISKPEDWRHPIWKGIQNFPTKTVTDRFVTIYRMNRSRDAETRAGESIDRLYKEFGGEIAALDVRHLDTGIFKTATERAAFLVSYLERSGGYPDSASSSKTLGEEVIEDFIEVDGKKITKFLDARLDLRAKVLVAIGKENRNKLKADILFESVWTELHQNPNARAEAILRDPSTVAYTEFDANRRALAMWQLEKEFPSLVVAKRRKGIGPVNPIQSERAEIEKIRAFIEKQLPRASNTRDWVIDQVEKRLITTPRESAILKQARLNHDNWTQAIEILAQDVPDVMSRGMKSNFDRLELIAYLTGRTADYPHFLEDFIENHGESAFDEARSAARLNARNSLDRMRRLFLEADIHARSYFLSGLLDRQSGILSEPETHERLTRLILGENYGDPMYRAAYEAYFESLPMGQERVVLGHLLGSLADSRSRTAGAGVRKVLEAMGPFGIRFGQFLRSTGLVGPELRKELDGFFDAAEEPSRNKIVKDLERAFGKNLKGVHGIHELIGAGSINYVVAVDLVNPSTKKVERVSITIQRDNVGGRVEEEDRIWERAAEKLMAEGQPESVRRMGSVVNELRIAMTRTIRKGGTGLDLRTQLAAAETAKKAYDGPVDPSTGLRTVAARKLDHFQSIVDANIAGDPALSDLVGKIAVFEFIPNTPLEDVTDSTLRSRIARQIVDAELRAIVERGVFDEDGHRRNWLIDQESGRLVRIDYAEIVADAPKAEINDFIDLLRTLLEPDVARSNPRRLARKLARVFDSKVDLARQGKLLASILADPKLPEPQSIADRFFFIRDRLEEGLKAASHGDPKLRLKETGRSILNSIGKLAGYREFAQGSDFETPFIRHLKVSPLAYARAAADRALRAEFRQFADAPVTYLKGLRQRLSAARRQGMSSKQLEFFGQCLRARVLKRYPR